MWMSCHMVYDMRYVAASALVDVFRRQRLYYWCCISCNIVVLHQDITMCDVCTCMVMDIEYGTCADDGWVIYSIHACM